MKLLNKSKKQLTMHQKIQAEPSIRLRIFSCLAVFTLFILLLLALFQVVFLDNFYKSIKINDIKESAKSIEENIKNENIQTLVTRVAQNNDICIIVMDLNKKTIYDASVIPDCMIHLMTTSELEDYIALAKNSRSLSYLERFNRSGFKNNHYDNNSFIGPVPGKDNGMTESIIYTKLVKSGNEIEYAIFLNSNITPVNSTVQTLRIQLNIVSVIMLVLAFVLAFIMSRIITKPIVKINNASKELAKGNYEAVFETTGYREIAELGSTLNFAATELLKVDELRRELIANISHDLRTPLTMITGYAEVMRDLPGENTPENIQVIIDESRRLSSLVNDVLDISKLQSGTQSLNKTEFNFTKKVLEILTRFEKLKEQDGYIIKFNFTEEITTHADEIKISQVIYNLLNNAITYTGVDKTVIVNQLQDNDNVGLEIIDSGEGIAPENLKDIWDRYYKVPKEHKRAQTGTGLGLSIVKSILTLHNASYGVKSTLKKGSMFWFKIKR